MMVMPRSQVEWRCRRGTKELDLLLRRYLDFLYDRAGRGEQLGFQRLLEQKDEDLWRYFSAQEIPKDRLLAKIVQKVRTVPPASA